MNLYVNMIISKCPKPIGYVIDKIRFLFSMLGPKI